MFLALSLPEWPTGVAAHELPFRLLAIAPRATIAANEGLAWLDGRGLDVDSLAHRAMGVMREMEIRRVHAAASLVPVVAATAARFVAAPYLLVPPGFERQFIATLPLAVLAPPPQLASLFTSVGLETCGDLAALDRESIEVRFGRDGLACWKHARADDPRLIFRAQPRTLPNASIDWTEFSTTDIEQLVFVMHSMLGTVCNALASYGMGARSITITLALEGGKTLLQQVGSSRPSFDRKLWLRLVRRALERITLPDRVAGIAIEVDGASAPPIRQGDLFDLGFASAQAAEAAVAHVVDLQGDAVVVRRGTSHPLPERRTEWKVELAPDLDEMRAEATGRQSTVDSGVGEQARASNGTGRQSTVDSDLCTAGQPHHITDHPSPSHLSTVDCRPIPAVDPFVIGQPQLTLRLLPAPREIDVTSKRRRGFHSPIQYVDNGLTIPLRESLGPQCLSGDHASTPFDREYYQGVRDDGSVVLMFRDGDRKQWYLAGLWD